jgi:uncharacterized protein YutE (UPF0331/DUF86 family)
MTKSRDKIYEAEIRSHIQKMATLLDDYREKKEFSVQDFFAVERMLQILIESLIGLARYVLKIKHNWIAAKSQDAIDDLLRFNFIASEEHDLLHRIVGYRNVLVHDYLNVQPNVTKAIVEEGRYLQVAKSAEKLLSSLD